MRTGSGALVLMYHRINHAGPDPWSLGVTPDHFRDHLGVLARIGRVVPLADLARRHASGETRPGDVAITFDDGYVDNLQHAAPALATHGMPATVFVTTGGLDARQEFWWDALERVFLSTERLPATLDLLGRTWHVAPPEAGVATWRAEDPPPGNRTRTYLALWQALYALTPAERSARVADLLEWAQVPPVARETHRAMTSGELRSLQHAGIEIGAHTVSHGALSAMDHDVRSAEIAGSRDHLAALLGVPPTGFAYPHGAFDAPTCDLVRTLGFSHASTTAGTALTSASGSFALPRLQVHDIEGAQFEAWVRWWMDW